MTCGCNDKCELPKALQINNPGEVTLFHRVDIPASQGDDTTYPPKNGLYRNVLLVYLANNHSYLYNSDGIPTRVDGPAGPGTAAGGETGQILAKRSDADYDTTWITQTSANDATLTISRNDTPVGTFTANASVDKTIDIEVPTKTSDLTNDGATGESTYAEATDINAIWEEIEEIEAASDVTDVVGTHAELEAYDTSKLKDNDIIKVLEDETQNDQITYYRWDTDTETFTLIGAIGPYYTKSEANTTFQGKLTAGSNITIDANNEISATDTTYTAGEGVNINGTTIAAKVRRVYNYLTSRPASANLAPTANGGMFTFQATNSMTTGKPKTDAHILQLEWDNDGGWDSQFAVANNSTNMWAAIRAQNAGLWGDWVYLLTDTAGSVKTANIDALAVTTAKIADGAITEAKINATDWAKKVNVASIDLTGQTTTLLALTKALGTNNIDYARWEVTTNIGSANISDKPTSYSASFVCEAYCNRWAANNDYRYQLVCYVNEDTTPYVAYVANDTSAIKWHKLVHTYSAFESNGPGTAGYWKKLGNLTFSDHQQGKSALLKILVGLGNNSNNHQQVFIDLVGQLAWKGSNDGRAGWTATFNRMNNTSTNSVFDIKVIANSNTNYDVYIKAGTAYMSVTPVFVSGIRSDGKDDAIWTPDYSAWTATAPSGTECDIAKTSVAMQADLPTKTSDLTNDGEDGTSTYVEEDELQPSYIEGEGTSITFPSTQGAQFKDIELKGDTAQGVALPDGYQQVEYIASAGGSSGAYIDSGVKASNTIKVVTTAALITSGFLFGEGLQGNWVNLGIMDANGYYRGRIRKDASSNSEVTSTVALGDTFHTIEISQGDGLWIDGSKIGTFTSYTFTATNTMYIHAWQNGSGASLQAAAKIKDFKIYDNNTLVKWFVPCKRISDGVAGYYEMVGGIFKPSASSTAFTAGGAIPTPSTPQTVHTVTGEQTVSVIGNNLIEITPSNHIVRGTYVSGANTDQLKITATGSDLYLNEVKAAGSTWDPLNQGNLIPCEYGETLYFNSGNASFTKNLVTEYDENKISLGYYGISAASGSFTTRFNGCKYISVRFGYEPATVGTTYTLAPMVSRTSITEYDPYTNQEFKINLGKNLLNTAILQTGFINESGVLQYNTQSQTSAYIEVLPNTTYTASADATYRVIGAAEFTAGKTFIKRDESIDISSYSLTTTGSTKYIRVYYNKNVDVTAQTLLDDKAQIEKGSVRTDYSVYADQIELCKIGNKQDYIYQNGDDWYLHKETAKIVDNGASGWGTSGAAVASGVSAYVHTGLNVPDYTAGAANMATIKTSWADWTTGYGLQSGAAVFSSNNYYFKISTSIASTVAQLQSFLGSDPLITYYALATATETQITDATLISQLNALASATGYRGTTAITATAPSLDLPAILSLSTALPSALPLATTTSVGMVSVGDGLEADANGRLSIKNVDNLVYASDPTTPMDNVVDPYTYSTTETRIGTWIDGKPLYRRVFTGTATTIPFSVATLTNCNVKNIYGRITYNGSNYHQIGGHANANYYSLAQQNYSNYNIDLYGSSNYVGQQYELVAEYTKTTD